MTTPRAFRLLFLLTAAALAGEARAADFTVYLGRVKPGSLTVNNVRRSLDGGPIYGFRLGHGFVPFVGLEHTLTFASHFSREHFLIDAKDGHYILLDRGSSCGTLVEGDLVGERKQGGWRRLKDHDVIIVGTSDSKFIFKFIASETA